MHAAAAMKHVMKINLGIMCSRNITTTYIIIVNTVPTLRVPSWYNETCIIKAWISINASRKPIKAIFSEWKISWAESMPWYNGEREMKPSIRKCFGNKSRCRSICGFLICREIVSKAVIITWSGSIIRYRREKAEWSEVAVSCRAL